MLKQSSLNAFSTRIWQHASCTPRCSGLWHPPESDQPCSSRHCSEPSPPHPLAPQCCNRPLWPACSTHRIPGNPPWLKCPWTSLLSLRFPQTAAQNRRKLFLLILSYFLYFNLRSPCWLLAGLLCLVNENKLWLLVSTRSYI